jgi:multidrug transporter EmrE-like cation transporter
MRGLAAHSPERDIVSGSGQSSSQRQARLASIDVPLLAAITAVPAVLGARHLPPDLLLPAIAAFALVAAAAAALAGLLTRAPQKSVAVTIWDFAGACVLIGVAAGAFSESVQVSQLLGIATTTP